MRRFAPYLLIPCSSLMPLIFTTRFGVSRYSFIKLIRSVPPARTSTAPQLEESMPRASFSDDGLAYSNACILRSPFFQGLEDPVGGEGNQRDAHADGVGDRVGDGGDAADGWRFPKADDAALVMFRRDVHVDGDFADIADACELVELHFGVQHRAGCLIHDALFHQRAADAHDAGAGHLGFGQLWINHKAAILNGDHTVHLDDAGFDVDRNVGDLNAGHTLVGEAAGIARVVRADL